jgi:hypothetical protein
MSFPVFASGDVLNASDMNAVGMWLVKSVTVGAGVTTIPVTGAFSADYENYLITYTGGTGSGTADISLQLTGGTGSDYDTGLTYTSSGWGGSTPNFASTTGTSFAWCGNVQTQGSTSFITILKPFLAQWTLMTSQFWSSGPGWSQGRHKLATSYTGFSLIIGGGLNTTGGTVRVYGYTK